MISFILNSAEKNFNLLLFMQKLSMIAVVHTKVVNCNICIGKADHSFQGGLLYIGPAPPGFILILQNRWKMKILILQGGLAPPLPLR